MDVKTSSNSGQHTFSFAPNYSPCQQVKGQVKDEEVPQHVCFKLCSDMGRALKCRGCKSPNRLCYPCLLVGKKSYAAGPPDGKGLCLTCLGFRPALVQESGSVPSEETLPEREAASPVPVSVEQLVEIKRQDQVVISTTADDIKLAMEIAQEVCTAREGAGTMPRLLEVFFAVMLMRKAGKSGPDIGCLFDQSETSAPVWVSNVAGLWNMSREAWTIIDNIECTTSRKASVKWAYKISKQPEETQLVAVREWAASNHSAYFR